MLAFSEACEYLALSPAEVVAIREKGLIALVEREGHQEYPESSLELTRQLLVIGTERGWEASTLAWYADLMFASNIGRAILLPLHEKERQSALITSTWLGMPYHGAVLEMLLSGKEYCDNAILTPLTSLIALAVGEGQFWPDVTTLMQSTLAPVINHFEKQDIQLLNHGDAFARDVGTNYAMILFAFVLIAPPISPEFSYLVQTAKQELKGLEVSPNSTPLEERRTIAAEPLIPVDKFYASRVTDIHSLPERWDFKVGIMRADRQTVAVQMRLPADANSLLIDNILDMVRPFLGPFGARVVQLLYEVANDAPYYRNPVITIDTNEILDRLGQKRDTRNLHRSGNRERLRDALNAAHALEIVGEYTTWDKGKQIRRAFYRTVLSIIGATFDAEESASLSTLELRERGLPKSMQIRLNFYDGIRRPDGSLGDQFVLMPRLPNPQNLVKANHGATQERLKAFFLFRFRQMPNKKRVIVITRQTALEKADITNKNPRQANVTLKKALDKLVSEGILESYSTPLPKTDKQSIEVVLSETLVKGM